MKKLVILSLLFVLSFGMAQAGPFDLKEKQEVKTEFVATLIDVDFIDVEVSDTETTFGYSQLQFDVIEAIKLPAAKIRWRSYDNSIIFNESIPKEPLVNLLIFRQKVLRG